MWAPSGREAVDPGSWDIGDSQLPPTSLEAFQDCCRSYSEGAWLGWDQFHPKLILQLPLEYQVRVLRIIQAFEDRPTWMIELVTNIVFIPKPEGGSRPIGLL
eukprot:3543214-Pyramimonas_sp.AAC.1